MNRKQRRALAKGGKRSPAGVHKAIGNIESAVKHLDKIKGFDETLDELQELLVGTKEAMDGLLADNQAFVAELAAQRETNIRLLTILLGTAAQRNLSEWSDEDLARVRDLEGALREQLAPQDGS